MWRGFGKAIAVIVIGVIIANIVRFYSVQNQIPIFLDFPIYAVITLAAGYLVIRVIGGLIWRVTTKELGVTRGAGAKNFFQIIAAIALVAVVIGLFGYSLTDWLVGAGFIGIVLGLAAQQALGNIFAGIAMLFARPFDIGDRITIITSSYGLIWPSYAHETLYNGYTGIVQDIGIFYTRIFQDEGVPCILPNSVVISSLVLNHSKVAERTVRVRMDLDKGTDYNEFKKLLVSSFEKENSSIIPGRSKLEIVDIGGATYQIVISVWTKSTFEEPVKTFIIQAVLSVQESLLQKKQEGEKK